jgi:hypothetical protein
VATVGQANRVLLHTQSGPGDSILSFAVYLRLYLSDSSRHLSEFLVSDQFLESLVFLIGPVHLLPNNVESITGLPTDDSLLLGSLEMCVCGKSWTAPAKLAAEAWHEGTNTPMVPCEALSVGPFRMRNQPDPRRSQAGPTRRCGADEMGKRLTGIGLSPTTANDSRPLE